VVSVGGKNGQSPENLTAKHQSYKRESLFFYYFVYVVGLLSTISEEVGTWCTTTTTPFNDLFSRTTWVSRYQKGKNGLDLNETRDDGV